jgi:hypothetical protein
MIALAGEVLVNLGGEPERDDSGLPPVDIEVPDDARELDRDVQAYRRELRALRRRERRMRLHLPLTHDGVVLPLLASVLVMALIAGTLLTVFTAGPGGELSGGGARPTAKATATSSGPTASSPPVRSPSISAPDSLTAKPGKELPDKPVRINGGPVGLTGLTPAVLLLVPARCKCAAAARQLVKQALAASLHIYLFAGPGQAATVHRLAAQAPGQVFAAEDMTGALSHAYPHSGLTALLARQDGTVHVASLPSSPRFQLAQQLGALGSAATATAPVSSPPAVSSPTVSSAAITPTAGTASTTGPS